MCVCYVIQSRRAFSRAVLVDLGGTGVLSISSVRACDPMDVSYGGKNVYAAVLRTHHPPVFFLVVWVGAVPHSLPRGSP